jgi:hypothetical protein
MASWTMPPGVTGDASLIRTNPGAARANARECPLARSVKARPLLRAEQSGPDAEKALQGFTLKVLMDALDMIERDRRPVEWVMTRMRETRGTFGLRRPPAHPGLLEWTAGVIPRYLAARAADQQEAQLAGKPPTLPVPDNWVARQRLTQPDSRGTVTYEQTAWGRRYAAGDGSARDLWLLSFGRAKDDRPAAEKAAAAYAVAFGLPCTGGGNDAHQPVPAGRLPPGRTAAPDFTRIIEFGCGDGRFEVLLEWDQDMITRQFASDARPVLAQAVDDTRAIPGSSCVECKVLAGCTLLVRADGLVPVQPSARSKPRRSISASDLRSYADCPAKYHLTRQLKLPSLREERAEIRLGRTVDAWLNERHLARPAGGCRTLPGPANSSEWSAGKWSVSGQEAMDGAGMLGQHAAVCPLDGLDDSESVLVQHQVTCYDPRLDVVLIAVPDLLHTRRGGWVWRETKTSSSSLYEGKPLLVRYPQLAFGVLMLAAGVLGGKLPQSRVELELLQSDDLALEELDPSRPQVISEARDVLADLATPWESDSDFEATPGRYCQSCEALDWCQPGRAHVSATAPAC